MQLPRRLARRLLDLQFLPHVVVTNPHIRRVYDAYFHAFNILRAVPIITTWNENASFSQLLRRLVDEHGSLTSGEDDHDAGCTHNVCAQHPCWMRLLVACVSAAANQSSGSSSRYVNDPLYFHSLTK